MGVFPDFDGLDGIGDLRAVVGALLTFVLIVAVLMLIVWVLRPPTATTPPQVTAEPESSWRSAPPSSPEAASPG